MRIIRVRLTGDVGRGHRREKREDIHMKDSDFAMDTKLVDNREAMIVSYVGSLKNLMGR